MSDIGIRDDAGSVHDITSNSTILVDQSVNTLNLNEEKLLSGLSTKSVDSLNSEESLNGYLNFNKNFQTSNNSLNSNYYYNIYTDVQTIARARKSNKFFRPR